MVLNALLTARRLTPDHEVIVINDGSRDLTPQILDELARVYPQVRIVHHQKNRGYGGALRSGFEAASKEFIFYTDGDAQYDPSEMALLWERMADDVDLVNGYKISRSDPWHRIVIGRLYHHTVKTLFGPARARRRLRLPPDAPQHLRAHPPRKEQRRHLPRADEEGPRRGLPHRGSAGPPLSSRLRAVAVLQLPPDLQDGHRRAEAVARAGDPPRASARAAGGREGRAIRPGVTLEPHQRPPQS